MALFAVGADGESAAAALFRFTRHPPAALKRNHHECAIDRCLLQFAFFSAAAAADFNSYLLLLYCGFWTDADGFMYNIFVYAGRHP